MTGAPPTVVLVDDHALFRAGVRAELEGRVDVVGEAGDVASAVRAVMAEEPLPEQAEVHLGKAYDHFNAVIFDGLLPDCLITLFY